MKTSEVLSCAKRFLARDYHETQSQYKQEYICLSIREAHFKRSQPVGLETCQRVQGLVGKRLAPFVTLEDWLEGYHNVPVINSLFTYKQRVEYTDRLQLTRHAWIDSMIAEFQSSGD